MWRDILIIFTALLATLTYLNLTPRQLTGYARTAKAEATKQGRYQRIFLLAVILASLLFIFTSVYAFENLYLEGVLLGISLFTVMWCSFFIDVWKVSKKWEKVIDTVAASVILPSFIACMVLVDMPLWQKLAYPIGGGCLGYGSSALSKYIKNRKLKRRLSSRERNK